MARVPAVRLCELQRLRGRPLLSLSSRRITTHAGLGACRGGGSTLTACRGWGASPAGAPRPGARPRRTAISPGRSSCMIAFQPAPVSPITTIRLMSPGRTGTGSPPPDAARCGGGMGDADLHRENAVRLAAGAAGQRGAIGDDLRAVHARCSDRAHVEAAVAGQFHPRARQVPGVSRRADKQHQSGQPAAQGRHWSHAPCAAFSFSAMRCLSCSGVRRTMSSFWCA